MLACLLPLGDVFVYEVVHHLHFHAKIGGIGYVPHGEGELESHQLCVAGVFLGDEEGDKEDVLHPHPQPHIGVRQVYPAEVDWPNYTRSSDLSRSYWLLLGESMDN